MVNRNINKDLCHILLSVKEEGFILTMAKRFIDIRTQSDLKTLESIELDINKILDYLDYYNIKYSKFFCNKKYIERVGFVHVTQFTSDIKSNYNLYNNLKIIIQKND